MRAAFLIPCLLLVTLAIACGDDSDATPTPSGATTTRAPAGQSPTVTATSVKTATAPLTTIPVAATPPGETPTPPPVAPIGTPAVAPEQQAAFVAEFANLQVDLSDCSYNPGTAIANCGGIQYAVDPPVIGQDVQCTLWSVDGTPRALACTTVEPEQTIYFEIG